MIGAILGAQDGQNVTMEVAFQAKLKANAEGEVALDDEWFSKRLEDCKCLHATLCSIVWNQPSDSSSLYLVKEVHKQPQLDIVGWFTLGPASGPEPHILPIQSHISELYTESPLLVLFNPENAFSEATAAGKLPLTLYEPVSVSATSEPNDKAMDIDGAVEAKATKFRELIYSIETGEAEMISVDFVARGGGNATAVEGSVDATSKAESAKEDEGTGKKANRGKQREREDKEKDAPIDESLVTTAEDDESRSILVCVTM